jgi:serine/threonine protein kinase
MCCADDNCKRMTRLENTVRWSAPELLSSPAFISSAADVWSLGCVLLEMVTNALPYADKVVTPLFLLCVDF